MAVATLTSDISASPTWRQFQLACFCVVAAIGVGCMIYGVETGILHCEHRFVENPSDTITRAIGLAHFNIGWLFLLSSPRLRNRVGLTRLTFCTIAGIAFCALFAWGGADKSPLMLLAFYSFFFVHEVCDEAQLFRQSGELPIDVPGNDRFLSSLCTSMSLLLMTALAALQIFRGSWLGRSPLMHEYSSVWLSAVWLCLAVAASFAVAHTLRRARASYGTFSETFYLYRPLFAVYMGISLILLIGSLFGSVGANLVILVHGMTWLVYTHRKLSERNAPVTGLWSWLRQSPTGFLTLHLAVTVAALVLFALRTHLWERTGLVCHLLSKTWFPYWSIMHIATAFWRK